MKKTRVIFLILTFFFLSKGHIVYGQDQAVIYSNYKNAYFNGTTGLKDTFFSAKINEIIINPDSTFEFWSRPHSSCFTWHEYKGTWKRNKDTLIFFDSYKVEENDTKAYYKRDARQEYIIIFNTDKNSKLKNRSIKVQYEYDFEAHLDYPEKIYNLDANNSVILPFKDIPNIDKLSAIRIEYFLNYTEKRYKYLTENKIINIRQGDIPNLINVEFIEKPKKEIVYRTIRAAIKNDILTIVSNNKTITILPDYYSDIEFEDSYIQKK